MGVLRLLPRLVYFAVAPFILVVAAAVLPMTALLLNLVLLLVGLAMIEALRGLSQRHALARILLRRQLAFEAYYREHPPRSFVYYVFFPLLFPYWLFNRAARQEVALYRGTTRLGLALIVLHAIFDYVETWAPEISTSVFVGDTIGIFVVQFIMLLAFIIPLSATLVTYQLKGEKRTVRLLLAVAALSVGAAMIGRAGMRMAVPVEATMRADARTRVAPERAEAAQDAALKVIWDDVRAGSAKIEDDGSVGGDTLERAHDALAGFYRADEAAAFTARVWPVDAPTHALVQIYRSSDRPPIWRARDREGQLLVEVAAVPAEIFNAPPTRQAPRRRR